MLATTLLLTLTLAGPPAARLAPLPDAVVDVAWLRTHRGDPGLVLLHVGPEAAYATAHIPGARFVSFDAIATHDETLSLELKPVAELVRAFRALGVTDRSRIVLYWDEEWVSPTTRVWFTLDRLGLADRTSILDGGLAAWRTAGGAVTDQAPPPVEPGPLTAKPRAVTVAASWLADHLRDPAVVVVDARTPQFWDGSDAGSQPRSGHIPGARNVPFTSLVADGKLLDLPSADRVLRAAGVAPGKRVVPYCHVGQQATVVYFTARRLGYDVRLYDGSFQQWSRLASLPVERLTQPRARLITTERLAQWPRGWRATVIDARSDLGAYLAGHIPGAVFLHNETLRATAAGVPGDMLSGEEYRALFERLGVQRDLPVIIYGAGDAQNFHATFVAWLLEGLQHPTVFLLDGGFAKWQAEGRPVTQEYPEVERGDLTGGMFTPAIARLADVRAALADHSTALVDARPAAQFNGAAGPQIRRGHIPGAVSHTWSGDLAGEPGNWTWRDTTALRAAYLAQGVTPDRPVIVYCNTGTEASHLYFALRELLDYPNVRIYVPSWTEWAARATLPIEGAAANGR